MEPKDLVCNFHNALELQMIGFLLESLYYWVGTTKVMTKKEMLSTACIIDKDTDICSAYTAGELGLLLPLGVQVWRRFYNGTASQFYWKANFSSMGIHADASTEADVKANILIQIIEKKVFSLEDLLDLYKKINIA